MPPPNQDTEVDEKGSVLDRFSVFDIPVGDMLVLDGVTYINKGFVKTHLPTYGTQKVLRFVNADHTRSQQFWRGIAVTKTSANGVWRQI